MTELVCPFCGRTRDDIKRMKHHIKNMHVEALHFSPFLEVKTNEEDYVRRAEKFQLPQITGFGWKRVLKLWENESLEIPQEQDLWVNLGKWTDEEEEKWLFKFQSKLYGLTPASKGAPLPGPESVLVPDATRTWRLNCTNFRLVIHTYHTERFFTKRTYRIIHFPWSMLSSVTCIQYSKDSIFKAMKKCYLTLVFRIEDEHFCLVFGDLHFDKATNLTVSIYKVALKAKIELAEFWKRFWKGVDVESNLTKFKEELGRELAFKERVNSFYQTFYTDLNPFFYFYVMKLIQ